MLNLNNVTLICIEIPDSDQGLKTLKICQEKIQFARSILFSYRKPITPLENIEFIFTNKFSWNQYNDFCLSLTQYIDTDYCLLVQTDGYIINPDLWNDKFLEYDFIGAPWPHQQDWRDLQNSSCKSCYNDSNRVGNGGFSLRSKGYLNWCDQFGTCEGMGEDQYLNVFRYNNAIQNGIIFAPPELAVQFSVENPVKEMGILDWRDTGNPLFNTKNSFGYHGKHLRL